MKADEALLRNFIQKHATALSIEGTVHIEDEEKVLIIACGVGDAVDLFLDELYKGYKNNKPSVAEVEPFLKGDKDYRGVFRIIE